MSEDDRRHDSYDQARRSFEELEADEQASFLVEATATTLARGLEQAGRTLAEGLQQFVRQAQRRSSSSPDASSAPGAAEPETAQRQTPRNGSSSTNR